MLKIFCKYTTQNFFCQILIDNLTEGDEGSWKHTAATREIISKLKFLLAQKEAIRNFLSVEMSVEELFKRAD